MVLENATQVQLNSNCTLFHGHLLSDPDSYFKVIFSVLLWFSSDPRKMQSEWGSNWHHVQNRTFTTPDIHNSHGVVDVCIADVVQSPSVNKRVVFEIYDFHVMWSDRWSQRWQSFQLRSSNYIFLGQTAVEYKKKNMTQAGGRWELRNILDELLGLSPPCFSDLVFEFAFVTALDRNRTRSDFRRNRDREAKTGTALKILKNIRPLN